jgi:hypothetical protein
MATPSPTSTTAALVRYVGHLLLIVAALIFLLACLGLCWAADPGAVLETAIEGLTWVAGAMGVLATGGVAARKAPAAAEGLGGMVRAWRGSPGQPAATPPDPAAGQGEP